MATCPFCETECPLDVERDRNIVYRYDCGVCGHVRVFHRADEELRKPELDKNLRVLCISENIGLSEQGSTPIWFASPDTGNSKIESGEVSRNLQAFWNQPIIHATKPEGILRVLAEHLRGGGPFDQVKLTKRDMYRLKIRNAEELLEWLYVLLNSRLIESSGIEMMQKTLGGVDPDDVFEYEHQVTPKGWAQIHELFSHVHSRKVFIAMWFRNPDRVALQEAIEAALRPGGWDGKPVDNREFLGKIDDQIIAEINQSKFVICEFTGNNAGVYYEAGYAAGRGLPVIYVARESDIKDLHFDTNHINHIAWKDYADLTSKLTARIGATINQ